jgi:hypothetical protein
VPAVRGAQSSPGRHQCQFRLAQLTQQSSLTGSVCDPRSKTVINKVPGVRATVFRSGQSASSSGQSYLLRSPVLDERWCLAPLHLWQHDVSATREVRPFVPGSQNSKMAAAMAYIDARTGRSMNLRPSPNSSLQRTALGIKCSAAGGRAPRAHERWRARVLRGQCAVAELGS